MVLSQSDAAEKIDRARVGVLAWRTGGSGLRACGITPFIEDGRPVVTSTLAFTSKMAAIRREPSVALLAGGVLVQANASVSLDLDGRRFGRSMLDQEVRKYPPTAQLRQIPGHPACLPGTSGGSLLTSKPWRWRERDPTSAP